MRECKKASRNKCEGKATEHITLQYGPTAKGNGLVQRRHCIRRHISRNDRKRRSQQNDRRGVVVEHDRANTA